MAQLSKPPPWWQRALGVVIGTAVGGIIYGIFLQALLFQSLLFDRRPLDPAEWRDKLTARAWICGLLLFLTLTTVPLRFLTRTSLTLLNAPASEAVIAWALVALLFVIQLATVAYARMRPELCTVEHPTDLFRYSRCLQSRFSLTLWKNWVQFSIIGIEFLQLMSMALSPALYHVSPTFLSALWQLGMTPSPADPTLFFAGFGLLSGFGGLYILLCGIFIALDLTAESPLAPLLFTLLAGGFYGTVTSGLLFVIVYSPVPAHTIVGLLMLAYYSSTAVFVSIYRSDVRKVAPGEIRLMPLFTASERVLKGILAVISVITATTPASPIRFGALTGIALGLVALLLRLKPYSARGLTALRITALLITAWTALISLLAAALPAAPLQPPLIVGWILIPFAATAIILFGQRRTRSPITVVEFATVSPVTAITFHPLSPRAHPESSAAVPPAPQTAS